jgi:hypothetical protein
MTGARIGKIRMKAGGAIVRVLDRVAKDPGDENWRGKLIEHARIVAGYNDKDSDLVGFVVIGLFSDGAHSLGFRWNPDRSPIPRRLMPSYLAELVREDMISSRDD